MGSAVGCSVEGCLIASTGVCARQGTEAPCELAIISLLQSSESEQGEPAPDHNADRNCSPMVHVGQELGLAEAEELMAASYARVVTVLGEQDAGKTSVLLFWYFACSCLIAKERGLAFAGSLTLPGFESRASETRQWMRGAAPSRMTIRTSVGEDRAASFLHLDVLHEGTGELHRLLLTDLPGEWTRDWIDDAVTAEGRFDFILRSDAILFVVNGELLAGDRRHAEVYRLELLVDRVAEVGLLHVPIMFVATRRDRLVSIPQAQLDGLQKYAIERGFKHAAAHWVTTFPSSPDRQAGEGVLEVLKEILEIQRAPPVEPVPAQRQSDRIFGHRDVMRGHLK